jgi:5-methylcytosine-specific restriction endonuclease McrA
MIATKVCTKCGIERSQNHFNVYTNLIVTTKETFVDDVCYTCVSKLSTNPKTVNSRLLKLSFKDYKRKLSCKDCGSKTNIQFHHVVPSMKSFTISHMITRNMTLANIRNELKKCVPVCPECHARIHGMEFVEPVIETKTIPYEVILRYREFFKLTKASKSYIFRKNQLERELKNVKRT